jgi:endonuclease/exonuclease/phosphatase family metal-dependent hydrolase
MQSNPMSHPHSVFSRRVVVSIALFVGLVGFACSCFAAGPDGGENELLVMTFNIRYGTADDGEDRWENRKEQVCKLIERNKCDVIGLQEALRFQIDAIREALPEYGEIGVGRDDGKAKGEYSGILYRRDRIEVTDSGTFWLSDTPETIGSTSWGNTITRICTWGRFIHKPSGKAFYHFNTHFDHQSQPSREKSAVLVAQRIAKRKHPDPVILTGDFNAGESNPAIRYLKGDLDLAGKTPIPLVDTFRLLHPEATEVGTFHSFTGDRSRDKIDYIFVQPGAEVLEAAILHDNENGRYPSDHYPVTATLLLRN